MSVSQLLTHNRYDLFCRSITVDDDVAIGKLDVTDTTDSTSPTDTNASISTLGGLSVAKNISSNTQLISGIPTSYSERILNDDGTAVYIESDLFPIKHDYCTYDRGVNDPAARFQLSDQADFSDDFVFFIKAPGAITNSLQECFRIKNSTCIISNTGLVFSNIDGGQFNLSYYERATLGTTATGPFAAAQNVNLYFTRIGSFVSMHITNISAAAVANTIITITNGVPLRFRPVGTQTLVFPAFVTNNSVVVLGSVSVNASTGACTIAVNNSTAFTAAGTAGLSAIGVSWARP